MNLKMLKILILVAITFWGCEIKESFLRYFETKKMMTSHNVNRDLIEKIEEWKKDLENYGELKEKDYEFNKENKKMRIYIDYNIFSVEKFFDETGKLYLFDDKGRLKIIAESISYLGIFISHSTDCDSAYYMKSFNIIFGHQKNYYEEFCRVSEEGYILSIGDPLLESCGIGTWYIYDTKGKVIRKIHFDRCDYSYGSKIYRNREKITLPEEEYTCFRNEQNREYYVNSKGRLEGLYKEYHENGNLKYLGWFCDGKLCKEWYYIDQLMQKVICVYDIKRVKMKGLYRGEIEVYLCQDGLCEMQIQGEVTFSDQSDMIEEEHIKYKRAGAGRVVGKHVFSN